MPEPREVLGALRAWLDRHEWKGFDPFDGLESPLGNALPYRIPRLVLLQAVKRSPVNLRPLLGVRPQENAMALACGILGDMEARRRGEERDVSAKVGRLLELRHPATGLWGYPFAWQARAFFVPANHPNLVISAVCLRALMDAGDETAIDRGLESLFKLFWRGDYFSYVDDDSVLVHNANLFGAEIALRAGKEIARRAVETTLKHQEKSGRWSYGTLPHHAWADCFHSAYNLVSLIRMGYRGPVERGAEYYFKVAFTPEGDARYYDNETWPLETHSYAAAFVLFAALRRHGMEIPVAPERVFASLVRQLYLGDGEFAYRKWPRRRVSTVFTRWTQAWMYYGLECLLSARA